VDTGREDQLSSLAPNGLPWWKLRTKPGGKGPFGTERRIAAYLWFNVDVGTNFTMKQLREALGGDGVPQADEHLNRRLRSLRPDGWIITSYKDEPNAIPVDEYRLDAKGLRAWLGERRQPAAISARIRREVLERDAHRCVVCGVGAGEPYPGELASRARLTIGHRVAAADFGAASLENLRAECSRCNEPVRDEIPVEDYASVLEATLSLTLGERKQLATWLRCGERPRSTVDLVFDRARLLLPGERSDLVGRIDAEAGMVGEDET